MNMTRAQQSDHNAGLWLARAGISRPLIGWAGWQCYRRVPGPDIWISQHLIRMIQCPGLCDPPGCINISRTKRNAEHRDQLSSSGPVKKRITLNATLCLINRSLVYKWKIYAFILPSNQILFVMTAPKGAWELRYIMKVLFIWECHCAITIDWRFPRKLSLGLKRLSEMQRGVVITRCILWSKYHHFPSSSLVCLLGRLFSLKHWTKLQVVLFRGQTKHQFGH